MILEGGSGSGNFGHSGRPGEVGGSLSFAYNNDVDTSTNFWASLPQNDYSKNANSAYKTYVRSGYVQINAYLRGKTEYYDFMQGKRVPFTEDLKMAITQLLPFFDERFDVKIPEDITVYRSTNQFPDSLQKGVEFTDKAYTSTTLLPSVAFSNFGGGVLYRIHLKKGQKVALGHIGERELILPRGSKFKVTNRFKTSIAIDNYTPVEAPVIDLEIVE